VGTASVAGDDDFIPDNKVLPGDDEGADTPNAPGSIDQKARAQFINDEMRGHYQAGEVRTQAINAITNVLASIIKTGGSRATMDAGIDQAAATIGQAAEQYIQTQAAGDQDYANEMRDQVASILETLKSIEQARHSAMSNIAQIA
jgi:hypothetical protein